MGVRHIVALRGDPPKGNAGFQAREDGFKSSVDLIAALAETGQFDLSVGAYPELHPEATDMNANIDWLKAKFEAGATQAITQFFFDAEDFLRFRDRAVAAGITIPIHPGILLIENFGKMMRFAERCQAKVPPWMAQAFGNAEDEAAGRILATAIATEICDTLLIEGAPHLHMYTLNDPDLAYDVCRALGREAARFGVAASADIA